MRASPGAALRRDEKATNGLESLQRQVRRALNARGFSQGEKRYLVAIAALRQSARVQRALSLAWPGGSESEEMRANSFALRFLLELAALSE